MDHSKQRLRKPAAQLTAAFIEDKEAEKCIRVDYKMPQLVVMLSENENTLSPLMLSVNYIKLILGRNRL